jgi:hypothetical protein
MAEIRALLCSQPEDAQRWLTTSQMGWALTRERNEITNEKDERDGKQVSRQLAPIIAQVHQGAVGIARTGMHG